MLSCRHLQIQTYKADRRPPLGSCLRRGSRVVRFSAVSAPIRVRWWLWLRVVRVSSSPAAWAAADTVQVHKGVEARSVDEMHVRCHAGAGAGI